VCKYSSIAIDRYLRYFFDGNIGIGIGDTIFDGYCYRLSSYFQRASLTTLIGIYTIKASDWASLLTTDSIKNVICTHTVLLPYGPCVGLFHLKNTPRTRSSCGVYFSWLAESERQKRSNSNEKIDWYNRAASYLATIARWRASGVIEHTGSCSSCTTN
jgi:hypothetical protein